MIFFIKSSISFSCLTNLLGYPCTLSHSALWPIQVLLGNNKDKKPAGSGARFDLLTLTNFINYLLNFKALVLMINIVRKIRCACLPSIIYYICFTV